MQQEEQGKSVQNITRILRNLIPLFGKSLHTFYAGVGIMGKSKLSPRHQPGEVIRSPFFGVIHQGQAKLNEKYAESSPRK